MVTVRKSKLLSTSSVVAENTYYYEFDVDTIAELPDPYYNGTIVAHGSKATIISTGRVYRINGDGEWCIQRSDASDPILIEKTITENGTYTALDDDVDGYSSVIANVPNTYAESDEGKVVDNGELVAQTARAESITANGTYDTTNNNSVTVDVVSENNAKVDWLDNGAFRFDVGLTSINIPDNTTSLADAAFYNCAHLESIAIPNSVFSFGDTAFFGCVRLRSIQNSNTLTRIGNQCFRNCTSLTAIEIPSTITTIGTNAFQGCSALETITINKAEGTVTGAPWGSPETTQIIWTG